MLDEGVKQRVLGALRDGWSIAKAAESTGMLSRSGLYREMELDPELRAAVSKARDEGRHLKPAPVLVLPVIEPVTPAELLATVTKGEGDAQIIRPSLDEMAASGWKAWNNTDAPPAVRTTGLKTALAIWAQPELRRVQRAEDATPIEGGAVFIELPRNSRVPDSDTG